MIALPLEKVVHEMISVVEEEAHDIGGRVKQQCGTVLGELKWEKLHLIRADWATGHHEMIAGTSSADSYS